MGRKPGVDRTPEEKWQIVQEGMKNGTCLRFVEDTGSLRRSTTVGRTKQNRERRQCLGGRALRLRKPRRIVGSGSWNAHWAENHWKLKS